MVSSIFCIFISPYLHFIYFMNDPFPTMKQGLTGYFYLSECTQGILVAHCCLTVQSCPQAPVCVEFHVSPASVQVSSRLSELLLTSHKHGGRPKYDKMLLSLLMMGVLRRVYSHLLLLEIPGYILQINHYPDQENTFYLKRVHYLIILTSNLTPFKYT